MFEDFLRLTKRDEEEEFVPMFSIVDEDEETGDEKSSLPEDLPILALKNTVLYPGVVIPITIGRDKSIKAVQAAHEKDKLIGVLSQLDQLEESPQTKDLHKIGTVARVIKLLKMPDGSSTAILQGRRRFELKFMSQEEPFLKGIIVPKVMNLVEDQMEHSAKMSSIKDMSRKIIELSPNIPSVAVMMLDNIKKDSFLLNFIASNLNIKVPIKQSILELDSLPDKADEILKLLNEELQMLQLKSKIESKVRGDIEKQQRDYFLNQQLKTIQEELGENPTKEELNDLEVRAKDKDWPDHAKAAFEKELNKAKRINPQMAEYSVTLNYLEMILDLPWNECTEDNFDLNKVEQVLDADHHGLKDVKDRIIEHLAVLKLKGDMKAPIVCLVGPPGVGKTSLGKSIAKALDRKFTRMSLGGLHDESEIRGHRKTYIGAMPGRIIKSLKKAESSNPVFILDEIDKIGKDFRGDPSSALLEVLDPEQNGTFYDNYLDLEYDLSKVLFIATANSLSTIQPALLDRMEIINISGYSTEEKVEIAKKHLLPKQRQDHGLKAKHVKLSDKTIRTIIEKYTKESGVRSLNRQVGGVMRSVAKNVAMEIDYNVNVKDTDLEKMLGPEKYSKDLYKNSKTPGVAVGLAWTRVGGDILFIEVSLSKGKGKLTLTGNLGDVMKESATTALSYIKSNHESLGIDAETFSTIDAHIHVPQGAIPKDGPSAGITMLTALTSAYTKTPIKPGIAMTGEITLRGKVLPVGGIKEKILAAKRAGIKTVILCQENKKNVDQINEEYIKDLTFIYAEEMNEVLKAAL